MDRRALRDLPIVKRSVRISCRALGGHDGANVDEVPGGGGKLGLGAGRRRRRGGPRGVPDAQGVSATVREQARPVMLKVWSLLGPLTDRRLLGLGSCGSSSATKGAFGAFSRACRHVR